MTSIEARPPIVIGICGLSASGKTQLSLALAAAVPFPRLAADEIRKLLSGGDGTQVGGAASFAAAFANDLYAELGRSAVLCARGAGGAIVDASFSRREDRRAFLAGIESPVRRVFAECTAPDEMLAQRAAARERPPGRVSAGMLAAVRQARSAWQPLDEVEIDTHLVLPTDRPIDRIVRDVLSMLDS